MKNCKLVTMLGILMVFMAVLAACGGGGGGGAAVPPGSYKIGGTVSGFSGSGLVLQNNNGDDLAISSNGTFTFATSLATGATYSVTVKTQPTCPSRVCTVTSGGGIMGSGNKADVAVACAPEKIMFFTSNWGDKSIRITDDITSLPSGTVAVPRTLAGTNTAIEHPMNDSISVDRARNLIYLADNATIKVFNNASTATGNIAPLRTVSVAGATLTAIAIDSNHDRLYVANWNNILVFNLASTISGTLSADAQLSAGGNVQAMYLDEQNDRLYATASSTNNINVFNNASGLTTGATPSRIASISGTTLSVYGLSVDTCSDRMYIASRTTSTNGNNIFAFSNASTMTGVYDADTNSVAAIPLSTAMFVLIDSNDRLYAASDSASRVRIYDNASLMSGVVSATPTSIFGAISSGYGMDYLGF